MAGRLLADNVAGKFPEFFAQPVDRETLSCREEELHDRLGGDLPHPFCFCRTWLMGKKSGYECNRRFPTNVRSRSESTCV